MLHKRGKDLGSGPIRVLINQVILKLWNESCYPGPALCSTEEPMPPPSRKYPSPCQVAKSAQQGFCFILRSRTPVCLRCQNPSPDLCPCNGPDIEPGFGQPSLRTPPPGLTSPQLGPAISPLEWNMTCFPLSGGWILIDAPQGAGTCLNQGQVHQV